MHNCFNARDRADMVVRTMIFSSLPLLPCESPLPVEDPDVKKETKMQQKQKNLAKWEKYETRAFLNFYGFLRGNRKIKN